ncbi:pyruvate dehydrogenase (acetyl-transferring) E1 component subunit alpha [Alicyclobacillus sp. SO9]|uniref:pyruvate dehydrogenase (acetyl-transferring) E1 component subunit alpha n=1 Tax=Alicyclobacillus sp. SO9 TaxID=2665646 RepID=UPI0018E8C407|nr:pyruvate dehydrogenase (acetyl-transferring) E1 component subunit alpha [Alicyclobacillus sp. SO9]QQE79790.1 pyruvate dehydrogenase (acetyl-transferring) E1 component subunit alpha [Alicyclobacillus sp. SO9]
MEDQFPIREILHGDGKLVDSAYESKITEKLAKSLFYKMLRARMLDQKCFNLQRQGRIGTYVQYEGQEASQIGSSAALEEGDWLFPTYRDHGAMLTFGYPMQTLLLLWKGRFAGNVAPQGKNIVPPSIPIASQLPQAAGAAIAERKKGTDRVSIVYFGDGATSEGDFHEGINFASVFNAPTIFFNQNNGFAISVPIAKQMKSKTIAQKSQAYDIEGVRIDGNDVFAVYFTTLDAIKKARRGDGPTLIESVTWRYNAHTTTDDASRYRNQEESKKRRETTDPLLRVERFMKAKGWIDDNWIEQQRQGITTEINDAIEAAENYPQAGVDELFDYVFEKPTWNLEEQKRAYLDMKAGVQ